MKHVTVAWRKLLELLKLHGYRTGNFTLTSGKESAFLIDCKTVILTAEGHVLCGELLLERLDALHAVSPFDAVAAVPVGACSLASAVSVLSWQRHQRGEGPFWDAVYVRKEAKAHGSRDLIVGGNAVPTGSSITLVEDVFTTGGSAIKAIQTLRDSGYLVEHVIALVDRQEGATEALAEIGVQTSYLYTPADFANAT